MLSNPIGPSEGPANISAGGSSGVHKDPPHTARFAFEVDKRVIGTFMEIAGLTVEMEVETYSEGGVNDFQHRFPGRLKYQNIVLKRGLTDAEALVDWFMRASQNSFRELTSGRIAMLDGMGKPLRSWNFSGAFPVKWSGPQFAASSTDIAVEELEFSHTGFLRG